MIDLVELMETYWTTPLTIAVALIVMVLILGRIAKAYGVGLPAKIPLEIINGSLKIDGTRYGGPVQLKDLLIEQACCVNLNEENELQPSLRTMGIGTRGYKSGWFNLRNGQSALVLLTDLSNVVYIPTRSGYALLLSVVDPVAFLDTLRSA